jgi:glycosyltransferase involved in cell wall biosynthesis
VHLVYAIDCLGSGGAQRQLVELARRVRLATAWPVSCLVYRSDDFYADRLRDVGIDPVLIAKRWKLDPRLPLRMAAWLREGGADVVHAFMTVPALWTLLALRCIAAARRPALIASERDESIATTRAQGWMQRIAYHGSDAVTANAEVSARAIEERLGVPSERVHYLPNGIDLEHWDRLATEPCPLTLEPGLFHLALVGRLQPQKNHALLLEALGRIDPGQRARWRVWFIGEATGGQRFLRGIEEQITRKSLQDTVRLVPPTPGIASLMRRLDLLVLPSRHEGFPNVLLEAMASGLPVVASRVGDVPNLVEDRRTGLLFENGDVEGLVGALSCIHEMPQAERAALGARARAVVEQRFSIGALAEAHIRLYERVAAQRRCSRPRAAERDPIVAPSSPPLDRQSTPRSH